MGGLYPGISVYGVFLKYLYYALLRWYYTWIRMYSATVFEHIWPRNTCIRRSGYCAGENPLDHGLANEKNVPWPSLCGRSEFKTSGPNTPLQLCPPAPHPRCPLSTSTGKHTPSAMLLSYHSGSIASLSEVPKYHTHTCIWIVPDGLKHLNDTAEHFNWYSDASMHLKSGLDAYIRLGSGIFFRCWEAPGYQFRWLEESEFQDAPESERCSDACIGVVFTLNLAVLPAAYLLSKRSDLTFFKTGGATTLVLTL